MSTALDDWKARLSDLPAGERAELAHFLLTTLDPDDASVEATWDAEASRRAEEVRTGRAVGRPVGELLSELRERYP